MESPEVKASEGSEEAAVSPEGTGESAEEDIVDGEELEAAVSRMGAVAEEAAAAAEEIGRDAAAPLPDDDSGVRAWLSAS